MFASTVDYQALYSPQYFGKQMGVASFSPDSFTQALLSFCQARGIAHVLDVGGGSGALASHLSAAGLTVTTCDFAPAIPDAIHLDLTGPLKDAERVRQEVLERTGGQPWLLCCLDVLEHMDREHIASALRNLRAMTFSQAIVSISTRPSSQDNRFHASIFPLQTWQALLRGSGLEVEDDDLFAHTRTVRKQFDSTDKSLQLVAHWAEADIFRDIDRGEPVYLLLAANGTERLANEEQFAQWLDIAHRPLKREQFDPSAPRIALNIHHPQDFVVMRPLLDVMRRGNVVALVRPVVLREDELSVIRGLFARCGVSMITFDHAEEIPWQGLGVDWLVSAAESNAAAAHILSRQIVEAAKLHGVRTLQLQHGLWIESFERRSIRFGSDRIISWTPEQGSNLGLAAKTGVAGVHLPEEQLCITPLGAPKFTDSLLAPNKHLIRWGLGVNTSAYRCTVLLGTNLKWPHHGQDAVQIRQRLARVMAQMPDVFFVVKLHPSERAFDCADLKLPNSIVLDDILLGCLDHHVSRLVAAVDVVISSLSTLLLDAAVAGKPCIQYDTGNTFRYAHLQPVAIEYLPALLAGIGHLHINAPLRSFYASASDDRFYAKLRCVLQESIDKRSPVSPIAASADFYSTASTVEDLVEDRHRLNALVHSAARESEQLRLQTTDMEQRLAAQSARHDAIQEQVRETQSQLHTVEARAAEAESRAQQAHISSLEAIEQARAAEAAEREARHEVLASTSWRLTAPLRRLRRLFK